MSQYEMNLAVAPRDRSSVLSNNYFLNIHRQETLKLDVSEARTLRVLTN
jgi:hypothetical protein